jgi:hypothetical protein
VIYKKECHFNVLEEKPQTSSLVVGKKIRQDKKMILNHRKIY